MFLPIASEKSHPHSLTCPLTPPALRLHQPSAPHLPKPPSPSGQPRVPLAPLDQKRSTAPEEQLESRAATGEKAGCISCLPWALPCLSPRGLLLLSPLSLSLSLSDLDIGDGAAVVDCQPKSVWCIGPIHRGPSADVYGGGCLRWLYGRPRRAGAADTGSRKMCRWPRLPFAGTNRGGDELMKDIAMKQSRGRSTDDNGKSSL